MSAFCQIDADLGHWTDPDAQPWRACGEAAIAVITFACVHEHIDAPYVCAACAAEIQRGEGLLICRKCESGPEPHSCPQVISIKWLAEVPK
jgi:hypothetical protein